MSANENTPSNIVPFPRRRRAAKCSKPMTNELAAKAKTMVLRLGMAQHEAAAKLGVNPGRVCEVVNGHKFVDAPFAPINDLT